MSLDIISLALIRPLLERARILCLGVPDMSYGLAEEFCGDPGADFSKAALMAGAALVHSVDVIAHKGYERLVDLNHPQVWPAEYDLVINPGTLEHCFNIGQAWANAWAAAALGGHILHVVPVSMLNHGFWNINPVALHDWCSANGGRVVAERYAINGRPGVEVVRERIPQSKSGRGCYPPDTVGYYLCQKHEHQTVWPTQGVYR